MWIQTFLFKKMVICLLTEARQKFLQPDTCWLFIFYQGGFGKFYCCLCAKWHLTIQLYNWFYNFKISNYYLLIICISLGNMNVTQIGLFPTWLIKFVASRKPKSRENQQIFLWFKIFWFQWRNIMLFEIFDQKSEHL